MAEDDFTPPSPDERVDEPFTPPPVESRVDQAQQPAAGETFAPGSAREIAHEQAVPYLPSVITSDQPLLKGEQLPYTEGESGIVRGLKATQNVVNRFGETLTRPSSIAGILFPPLGIAQAATGIAQQPGEIYKAFSENPPGSPQRAEAVAGGALTLAMLAFGAKGLHEGITAPATESVVAKELPTAREAVPENLQPTVAPPTTSGTEARLPEPQLRQSESPWVNKAWSELNPEQQKFAEEKYARETGDEPRFAKVADWYVNKQTGEVSPSTQEIFESTRKPITGEPNAIEPSNAQVQTGETPQRVEAGAASGEPPASNRNNVIGEAQGAAARGEVPGTETRQGTEAQPEVAPPEKPPVQTGAAEQQFELPNPVRGSGKFRQTYQVDKELGDRMEGIGASRESGALRAEIAARQLTDNLTPEEESKLGKYLVSERLKVENPEHPQILSPEETKAIESDPALKHSIDIYRNVIEPDIEKLHMRAGVTEEAAAAQRGKYTKLMSTVQELLNQPEKPGEIGPQVRASRLSRTTKSALEASGQASEYETNIRKILDSAYTEPMQKARVREFYEAAQIKGLTETGNFEDLPPELQHDLRAATETELQPTGIAKGIRTVQRATTGAALTANPPELVNHMRRQLNLVSAKPPIGRGLLSRLEALVPYIGPKTGTFIRTVTDNMSKPENMSVLQDIFDSGGGSSRSFTSMYKAESKLAKYTGVQWLQEKTHNLLFGIPKGGGVQGWDLRMRVQLEKIRRAAEGNTDPQRIREFSNQIGQYGSHPDWFVRGLRTVNPYAATTLPIRLTELKTAVGKSDLKSGGGGKLGRTAETLLRGTGGTLLGISTANYLLSGKWPWENDKGHEFDLNTGQKSADGKTLYVKLRVIAPELSRPVQTAGIPNVARERAAKVPQYLSALETALANQGLSLVSGPAQNALLTALTGKVPYITKAPGQRPEVMDVAKTEKGQSRGLEQIKHAAAGVNPVGTNFIEEPYKPKVEGPLKYVEQPLPGVRPFGSVFTQSYEKKSKPKSGKTKYDEYGLPKQR